MAEEEGEADSKPAPTKKKISFQFIFLLLNTIGALAALGMIVYTKLLFERPVIEEAEEIKKKKEEAKTPLAFSEERVIVPFDQMVINIAMTSGKAHYATLAFALECRNEEAATITRLKKAQFIDRVLSALADRQITELNTIQGKLLLKTDLLREFNHIVPPGTILDIYFSNFVVQ